MIIWYAKKIAEIVNSGTELQLIDIRIKNCELLIHKAYVIGITCTAATWVIKLIKEI